MSARNSKEIADRAKHIYEQQLKAKLEESHPGLFVAIEPISGDHFLGTTLSEAGAAARKAHPGNPSYIVRIGHRAAVQLGAVQ